jgi:hypothetical protein
VDDQGFEGEVRRSGQRQKKLNHGGIVGRDGCVNQP